MFAVGGVDAQTETTHKVDQPTLALLRGVTM